MKQLTLIITFIFTIGLPVKANSDSDLKEEYDALLLTFALEHSDDSNAKKYNALIDCNNEHYKPTASHKSLIGWSNRHHRDAKIAIDTFNDNPLDEPAKYAGMRACKSALRMRGAAHCVKPENTNYRNALAQSIELCKSLK